MTTCISSTMLLMWEPSSIPAAFPDYQIIIYGGGLVPLEIEVRLLLMTFHEKRG